MNRKLSVMLVCTAVLLLSGVAAMAQTITGSVRGTVTDPNGAVVPGAKVTITNLATGVTGQTVTDKSGLYNFEFLVPGRYSVTAVAPGFATATETPFELQVDQIASVNVQLRIGKASTSISVSASGVLLNAENSTVSASISSNTLENMPLDALNVQIATLYTPGAINPNSAYMGGIQGSGRDAYTTHEAEPADAIPSFNGNRQQSNSYILDGVDINETQQNAIGYNPSPYSLQEVHVITGNASAAFGNVNGGEVVMVTKNGTNQFHGAAFEYHQSAGLTANTWANKYVGAARSEFTQNQFGGAAGGPIIKNKLFFFGDYEGFRYGTTGPGFAAVPTSAMRGLSTVTSVYDTASNCGPGYGDFAAENAFWLNQYLWDTANGTNNEVPYPAEGTEPEGQCVPINPANTLFTYLQDHPSTFPLPNHAPAANSFITDNYEGISASINHNDQGDIRVDYTLNSKNTLMAKFTYGDAWDAPTEVPVPAIIPYTDDYPFDNAVLAWTHVFSSSMVNNARAGYTRILLNASVSKDLSGDFGINGNSAVGIGMPTGWKQASEGFAEQDVSSAEGWEMNSFGSAPPIQGYSNDNNFDYNDTLEWQHGKHVTTVGFDLLRYEQDYYSTSDTGGSLGYFMYSGNFTANWACTNDTASGCDMGYGYADFILDESSEAEISDIHGPFGQRQWRDAVFAQDDWNVTPKLTLNIGLRYSYMQPNYEVNNKMVNVNLAYAKFAPVGTPISSMLEYAGAYNPTTGKTNSRALIDPYRLGFMPRVGFAYMVTPKLVVRGGYGSTDDLESTGTSLRMTQNVQFQPMVLNPYTPGPAATGPGTFYPLATAFTSAGVATASGAGAQYYAWDPHLKPAIIQQYNLTLQYEINPNTTVQAGYVGQVGQHLAVPLWANQYTQDDDCYNLSGSAQDACYDKIEPYFALVGNPHDADYPGTDAVKETVSRGISNYNSLQVTLQHRQSKGLEFLVNYTFAKSMTNNVGYFGVDNNFSTSDSYWQDAYDPQKDYGPSSFDARQTLTGMAIYQLPFGRGKQFGATWNRLTDTLFGGWQFGLNVQANTGYPLTIHTSGDCIDNCSQGNNAGAPNGTSGSGDYFAFANHYHPMKIVNRGRIATGEFKWFGTDPSAEACATRSATAPPNSACAYGRPSQDFGTTAVGTERGPGFQNYDLALSKHFRTIKEETIMARVDAFNAFNIPSYAPPETYIGGNPSNFGDITSTVSGPRKIQLALVYQF